MCFFIIFIIVVFVIIDDLNCLIDQYYHAVQFSLEINSIRDDGFTPVYHLMNKTSLF